MPLNRLSAHLYTLQYEEAEQWLKKCVLDAKALDIFNLMIEAEAPPACWLAFLENPTLASQLDHKQITTLFKKLNEDISLAYSKGESPERSLHKARELMATNPAFCRRVSYQFFVNASNDPQWRLYLARSPHFLLHLDFVALSKMAEEYVQCAPIILQSLQHILVTSQCKQEVHLAALLLREVLHREPFRQLGTTTANLRNQIRNQLHQHFSQDQKEYSLWSRYVCSTPHLLTMFDTNMIKQFASCHPSFTDFVLQSLEKLLSPSQPREVEQTAASLLHSLLKEEAFCSSSLVGPIYYKMGNYFLFLDDNEVDISRNYLLSAWNKGYVPAAVSLGILESDKSSCEEGWEWLQAAMKHIPASDQKLRETLQSFAKLVKEEEHSLADTVQSAIDAFLATPELDVLAELAELRLQSCLLKSEGQVTDNPPLIFRNCPATETSSSTPILQTPKPRRPWNGL